MARDAEQLRRDAANLIKQAEDLERVAEPGGNGTVVMFVHQYAKTSEVYTMVAIRTKDRWQCTGGLTHTPVKWPTMITRYPELAAGRYSVATGWETHGE